MPVFDAILHFRDAFPYFQCNHYRFFLGLPSWRRQREQGTLEALSPKHRGPKVKNIDPSVRRIVELEQENNQSPKALIGDRQKLLLMSKKNSRKSFRYHWVQQEKRYDAYR